MILDCIIITIFLQLHIWYCPLFDIKITHIIGYILFIFYLKQKLTAHKKYQELCYYKKEHHIPFILNNKLKIKNAGIRIIKLLNMETIIALLALLIELKKAHDTSYVLYFNVNNIYIL